MRKQDLVTPALLLDLELFKQNIARMAAHIAASGKRLRPHAKAHKCVEIAKRQIAAGAAGICAATVNEVQFLAGLPGLLLTTPVTSKAKMQMLREATIVIDHPSQVDLWDSLERQFDVLIDLDVGDHRTGIPCDERAIKLAQKIDSSWHLNLRGVQAYSVSGSHTDGFDARKAHSLERLAPAVAIFDDLRRRGFPVEIFSGGSTGTWNIDTSIPALTELQAGSYVGMDIAYRKIGVDFAPAMSVLATVISANHRDRVTVDAGFKAFSTDRPFGPEPRGLKDVHYKWAGDEFGFLLGDVSQLRLGDIIEFDAPHCDPTFNLYDRVHLCQGDQVVDAWPLKGGARIRP